jgi:hypothetical protein
MENTCSLSEGGLAESFLFLSMWDHESPPSQILSYTQHVISTCKKFFLLNKECSFAVLFQSVCHKKNHQNLVKSIQHQQCCSKKQYSEQCENSGMRGLMLHKMKIWKCYVWIDDKLEKLVLENHCASCLFKPVRKCCVWTDDKLEKLVLEWKQISENHCASCLFKPGYQLSQLVGELNF